MDNKHPDARKSPADAFADVETQPARPLERTRPLARPKPPRRSRGFLRKFIWLLLSLGLILAIGYGIYIYSIISKVSTNSLALGPLAADATGRTNVLVLGTGDPGHAGEKLADSMMILSLDGPTKRMAQISLPRDLRVQIPGHGFSKINATNVYGGVELAEQTVSNTFDIPINYYIETNFSGLKGLVDAVGGLDVDVKERLVDREYPCDDNQYKACGLDIQPGLQHMDGAAVLKYVRCRKGTCGNDYGRAERQQEVLGLLRPKITDWQLLLHPLKLKALVTAVQQGAKTDLGLVQLLMFGIAVREGGDNEPVHLVLSTAPGGYLRPDPRGSSDLVPVGGDFDDVSERIKNIFSAPE